VLLCVNMQTSFMHPPFGFALFYLRGIAPPEVKSRDIYLGSIPWIVLQLILVCVLIFWPESVTYWLGNEVLLDDATVGQTLDAIPMPEMEMPGLDLGAPPDLGIEPSN